ncbi:hypothetical protein Tco_1406214 [Tanacetum coccineum]
MDNSREVVQDGRVKLVISKALIGSLKQEGQVEVGICIGVTHNESTRASQRIATLAIRLMEGDPKMEGIPRTLLAYPRISQSC